MIFPSRILPLKWKLSRSWPCIFILHPAFKICWITHPALIFRPIPHWNLQTVCYELSCFHFVSFIAHNLCIQKRILQEQLLFIPLASSGTYYFSYLLFTYHFCIKIKLHMLYLIHSIQTLTSSSQQSWHSPQECYFYHTLRNLAQVKKVAVPQWFHRKVSLVYHYCLVELDMHS